MSSPVKTKILYQSHDPPGLANDCPDYFTPAIEKVFCASVLQLNLALLSSNPTKVLFLCQSQPAWGLSDNRNTKVEVLCFVAVRLVCINLNISIAVNTGSQFVLYTIFGIQSVFRNQAVQTIIEGFDRIVISNRY